MTLSDPKKLIARAFTDLEAGNLDRNAGSPDSAGPIGPSKSHVKNEFSVRPATQGDSAMLESIEREAFPGLTPVTRISRDLKRENGLYLAAVREWRPDDRQLGPRFAIATRAEKEDDRFTARVKRNVDRFLLDYVNRPKLPPDYIAGFTGLWFVLDEAHVVIIGLREVERSKGIGELLLISGIEQAVENNSRVVTLEVRKSNSVAIELYRKYGFQEVGLRRRYYSDDGEDAVIMTTPPVRSDDYQAHFTRLVERHAEKWGWVARPGYSGPEKPLGPEEPQHSGPENLGMPTDSERSRHHDSDRPGSPGNGGDLAGD
ncbi:MAG: ribosomal protein S18-alanine N-acetyltransferase [Chloroflexi bacterium]|nr:ribosomal protein S18-alanine N-acetyltransferase [Chloroflexota bacterium]